MKSNTEYSRRLIEQALRSLPGDFALSTAKTYLSYALTEISEIEKKRGNRAIRTKKNEEQAVAMKQQTFPFMNPFMTDKQKLDVIGKIDQMIEVEQDKIKKVKEPKADPAVFLG